MRILLNSVGPSLVVLISLLSFVLTTHAQEGQLIRGQIVDDIRFTAVPAVHVINRNSRAVVLADSNGRFGIAAKPGDSLLFSVIGYHIRIIGIDTIAPIVVSMSRKQYQLKTVDIYAMPEWAEFKRQFLETEIGEAKPNINGLPAGENPIPIPLRSLQFQESPNVGQAIFHPFSYLFYHTNKTERSKRKVLAMMAQEQQAYRYQQVATREKIAEISGLQNEALDDFIVYCEQNRKVPYDAEPYVIIESLQQLWEQYQEEPQE